MSWRIAVRHRTGYRYAGPVRASYNEVRMTPPTLDGQRTLQAGLAITPAARPLRYVDYWGTTVDSFDIHMPHTELVVVTTAVVETAGPRPAPTDPDPAGADSAGPDPARPDWAALADPAVRDRFAEYLAASQYVTNEPDLAAIGQSLVAGRPPRQAGLRAAAWTHETLRYEGGATTVHTSSAQTRAAGKGVCQDFAHVTLALLRAMGLPARYVSGYVHPDADARIGVTTRGQSHAWVEFWAGDWIPVDPTGLAEVGNQYVLLARGRDYADVRPFSGIYSGPPAEHFDVTVDLTRLA
jgi:transglutaminase-like putative cysteine protease